MARKKTEDNGRSSLDDAMAALAQSQAMLIQNQAAFLGRMTELERVTAERFARIEADFATVLRILDEHGRILADHGRILERLPEAVREKIGFKSPT
jgi:hypothetical protein